MEITIKAKPEEIAELIQAMGSNKEEIDINEQTIGKISLALGDNPNWVTKFE